VRDSLLEVVLATGDGRLVKGGGRTVKGVAGYDVPRLAVGSLGTLGVITQVTLKLWPEPPARAWHRFAGPLEDRLAHAEAVRRGPVPATALLVTPDALHVCLEGPPEDVVAPRGLSPATAPPAPAWDATAEIGVPPMRLAELVRALEAEGTAYEAQVGVGICRAAPASAPHVGALRALAAGLGGHLQLIDAPEELRGEPAPPPPGLELMRRLRAAFDPAGVLNAPMFVGAAA
jgi:glycolate oxidase FAD binding subunit